MSTAVHTRCDAAIAQAKAASSRTSHSQLVLVATILASSLDFIDGSVVNVGLVAIGRDFDASAADLQWVEVADHYPDIRGGILASLREI